MSDALNTVLDHLRLLGRRARPEDILDDDLVLVKHISQGSRARLEGIFGQVHAEVRVVGKRRKKRELVEHYVADELLGSEDQLTFFENDPHATVEVKLQRLLRQLEKREVVKLLDETHPTRFFTGEICIFEDPERGYIRIEEYQAGSEQGALLRRSPFVRVVREVMPLSERERVRLLIN